MEDISSGHIDLNFNWEIGRKLIPMKIGIKWKMLETNFKFKKEKQNESN